MLEEIYILFLKVEVGPFSEEQVVKYLGEGLLLPSDLARRHSSEKWTPLVEVLVRNPLTTHREENQRTGSFVSWAPGKGTITSRRRKRFVRSKVPKARGNGASVKASNFIWESEIKEIPSTRELSASLNSESHLFPKEGFKGRCRRWASFTCLGIMVLVILWMILYQVGKNSSITASPLPMSEKQWEKLPKQM
jgi:hypothetical protein